MGGIRFFTAALMVLALIASAGGQGCPWRLVDVWPGANAQPPQSLCGCADGQGEMEIHHGRLRGSPAIGADGTVYVGSCDNKLYAINPDGSLKWAYTTGDDGDSSPAIGADGTVYVGSYDGKLYAINPDGSLKWSYTTGGYVRFLARDWRGRHGVCGER